MYRKILPALLCLFSIVACTNDEQFRVNGEIEGKPTMNIRVCYYANGAVHTIVTAAREGKFEFFGSAPQPAIVEITDYEHRPLARIYARNGETFDLSINREAPLTSVAEGNETTVRWSEFLRDNADVLAARDSSANKTIEKFVRANPDDVLSTLLFLTSYNSSLDPVAADSLLSAIGPKARPSGILEGYNLMISRLIAETVDKPVRPFYYDRRDTARLFDPADSKVNLIAFTNDDLEGYDSLADSLEKAVRGDIRVMDLRAANFKGVWYADTLKRVVGTLPGGIAARGVDSLGIPSLPFFIVADSHGKQIYRDKTLTAAIHAADSIAALRANAD